MAKASRAAIMSGLAARARARASASDNDRASCAWLDEPVKTCASVNNAAQAMSFDMMWLTRGLPMALFAADCGERRLVRGGRYSTKAEASVLAGGRSARPWGRAGRMIEPRLRGGDYTRRRGKKDEASRHLGYRSAGYEICGRTPFTFSRIDARMSVVIPVILRVNADQLSRGRCACVRVPFVAGLVHHAVVDVHARRPGNEDRQREKPQTTKATGTHHCEKLAGWPVKTRVRAKRGAGRNRTGE